MNLEFLPPNEIEKQRSAWFAEHAKPDMTMAEALELNAQIVTLFPKTDEERRQKAEDMENMPEFVL